MQKVIKWFKNYWYYYKWRVIVVAFVLTVVIFCVVQCSTQEKYSIFITYSGPDHISLRIEDIRSAVKSTFKSEAAKNAQGISVRDIVWVNSKLAAKYQDEGIYYNAAQNSDNAKLLDVEAASGDSFIYILDSEQYERLKRRGIFAPLSEIFGTDIPASAYDECGIKFKATELASYFPCFADMSDDLVLCLRTKDLSSSLINSVRGKKSYEKSYELHKSVFIDMVRFEVK